ncbi:unnamed protein product [Amoebophrya sp. A25]|nr:unnamed protein product [Amoebophrya sp. A25]|eukprot:GSA25T00004382001.1
MPCYLFGGVFSGLRAISVFARINFLYVKESVGDAKHRIDSHVRLRGLVYQRQRKQNP